MMNTPENRYSLKITIDNMEIGREMIFSLDITFSIFSGLPHGTLVVKDHQRLIHTLECIAIGKFVKIAVLEDYENERKELYVYPILMISQVVDGFEEEIQSLKGYVQIVLEHPWSFFASYETHAYKKMKNSELIKFVLEKGLVAKMNDLEEPIKFGKWEPSSDSGTVPRYMCGESDYEFITNKVLPYTTVNLKPVYFYFNEENKIFLQTFDKMFEKQAKFLGMFGSREQVNRQDLTEVAKKKNIDRWFEILSATLRLGFNENNQPCYESTAQQHIFYDYIVKQTIQGQTRVLTKTMFGNLLPISGLLGSSDTTTHSHIFSNRGIEDQSNLGINIGRDFNTMQSLEVDMLYYPADDLFVGCPVELYGPMLRIEDFVQRTWISEKWVIGETSFGWTNHQYENPHTRLWLIRPTFGVNETDTTVMMPELLASVS